VLSGLQPLPSAANFILIASERVPAATLVDHCRQLGVYLRDCDSLSRRFRGRFLRTAVKDTAANVRIAAALRSAAQ
jgi:histidinol-phosphate/aromatic aminotransferase/cobyric acid decarboxylase-like protein